MILSTWSFSSRKTGPSITTLAAMADCGDCGQSSAYRRATSAISRAHSNSTSPDRSLPNLPSPVSAVPEVIQHWATTLAAEQVHTPCRIRRRSPRKKWRHCVSLAGPADSLGRTGRTILRPTPFIRDLSAQTPEGRFLQIIFRLVEENSCLRTNPRKRALDLDNPRIWCGGAI